MVLDTSAIVALLANEADAEVYEAALAAAEAPAISAATVLEASLVLEHRHGPPGTAKLDQLLAEQGVQVVPFDVDQLALARAAYRRFGKGRHPAALDFGDCFAYALARQLGVPLLFKGDDFRQTDVESAL